MVKGHDLGGRVRGDQMGIESRDRKSFLPGLGWNLRSWDAQNGLRGSPWEIFEKGLSQIVGKVEVVESLEVFSQKQLLHWKVSERNTMKYHDC